MVSGTPVSWGYWTIFQRIFGASGFLGLPMARFGIHIAIVALFVAASAIGVVLVRNASAGTKSFPYRQGVLLCLTGGWSLLTLPYFAGRSLPSTAVGGYAYSVGLVTASLLPLIRLSLRTLRGSRPGQERVYGGIGVAMGLVALVGVTSATSRWEAPSHSVARVQVHQLMSYAPLAKEVTRVDSVADRPQNARLRQAISAGLVEQALPIASLMGISTRMRSGALVSTSEYYSLSRFFTGAQCSSRWRTGTQYLLVLPETAQSFAKDPACQKYFDFPRSRVFVNGASRLALLARRT
jgi:hypothetical protein